MVPAAYAHAEAGGLMSYGSNVSGCLASGRPLYRPNPEGTSDLPITQPTKFELVINLKTAKTLGLDVPASRSPARTR